MGIDSEDDLDIDSNIQEQMDELTEEFDTLKLTISEFVKLETELKGGTECSEICSKIEDARKISNELHRKLLKSTQSIASNLEFKITVPKPKNNLTLQNIYTLN